MNCFCIEILKKKKIIIYNEKYRSFSIKLFKNHGRQRLNFCLICGKKFKKHLIDEFYIELQKYFKNNLEKDIDLLNDNEIPEEFRTDEWWIKRGL